MPDGLRSCDLATAHVVIDDVPPRQGRQWNPAFQRAGIVRVPGIARFRVETDTGPIDFALYDTHRRPEVPREVLSDAILAGPDRYGQAGQDTEDAVRKLRQRAVAALKLRGSRGGFAKRLDTAKAEQLLRGFTLGSPNSPPIKDSKNSAAQCAPSSRASRLKAHSAGTCTATHTFSNLKAVP
ncbi:hypothetical protein [Actinomadura nitritigenes]|uniref:hypothetical protein n=1 Tax=Actinomadura nitritigenes TaxID=134602 RepID=UPI003D8BDC22